MAWLTYGVLFYFINLSLCEDCVLEKGTPKNAWKIKLQKDLKCNYDTKIPDTNSSNGSTLVLVDFELQHFSFDTREEIFNIYIWARLNWDDNRLKWNPNDYGDVTEIHISGSAIWCPELTILNAALYEDLIFYLLDSLCLVKSSGHVTCVNKMVFYVGCGSKLSDWPYDTQRCELLFGDKVFRVGRKVIYNFNNTREVSMLGAEYGAGWNIISYEQKKISDEKIQLKIDIGIERQAGGLAAIVVIPSVVVCLLTVSSMLLDVRDDLRLGVICFSLLIHYKLLSVINESIPKHSVDTPTLLLFVRGSTSLTLFVILLSFVLIYLIKKVSPPPAFIDSVIEFVFKSHTKYFIWPRWEAISTEMKISEELNVKSVEHWSDFASLINSVCLFVVVTAYVTMFGVYMPIPTPSSF